MVLVTFPRRLIMNGTGQIHPAGDVRHILPEPGMVLPKIRDAKYWCSLKSMKKMQNNPLCLVLLLSYSTLLQSRFRIIHTEYNCILP